MYKERFTSPHALGVERLTGSHRGLYYTNEAQVEVEEEGKETPTTYYEYDVYEVDDVRNGNKVKNDLIEQVHPNGDEIKILRKTLAKLLQVQKKYDNTEFSEFKSYNELANGIE